MLLIKKRVIQIEWRCWKFVNMLKKIYCYRELTFKCCFSILKESYYVLATRYNFIWKQLPRGVLWKKVFLEISQNSQENTCARVRLRSAYLLKKRLWYRCFSVNFAKFLKTHFFIEHLWWLLLYIWTKESIFNVPQK